MRKFESFISKKNTTSTIQIFFSLWTISASNDHFALRDWGEFEDSTFFASLQEHPVFSAQVFSRVKLETWAEKNGCSRRLLFRRVLSKSLWKALGLQKGL